MPGMNKGEKPKQPSKPATTTIRMVKAEKDVARIRLISSLH